MPSQRPWTVERQDKGGYHVLSIRDADGFYIANLVPHPSDERHRENARLICEAVNALPFQQPLSTDSPETP